MSSPIVNFDGRTGVGEMISGDWSIRSDFRRLDGGGANGLRRGGEYIERKRRETRRWGDGGGRIVVDRCWYYLFDTVRRR